MESKENKKSEKLAEKKVFKKETAQVGQKIKEKKVDTKNSKKVNNKTAHFEFERTVLEEKNNRVIKKIFQGEVVSDKMEKTIVVKVLKTKLHSKYQKRYQTMKKYKVHDPNNKYKVGDVVEFVPCRPYSREKRWIVCKKG